MIKQLGIPKKTFSPFLDNSDAKPKPEPELEPEQEHLDLHILHRTGARAVAARNILFETA